MWSIKYRKMPDIYSKMPNAETCPITFSILPDKHWKNENIKKGEMSAPLHPNVIYL